VNHDLAAEEAVLGGILLAGTVPPSLMDAGLKPGHFYSTTRAHLFTRALRQHDRGEPIDTITVPELAEYSGGVPNLGSLGTYARRITEKALWRTRRHAALQMLDASDQEDEDQFAGAEQKLLTKVENDRVYDTQRLGTLVLDRLEATIAPGWKVPFFTWRMAPGTVHLWGGWTSHGKTVWIDQVARELHKQGATVWAWLNEMTADERMCRFTSAATGIELRKVMENNLTEHEKGRVASALSRIPFGIVECPGWNAEDIARDIRVRQPDVAIIDILHRIPYRDERDLARISQLLGDTAKLARCVVLCTVHLNRGRIIGAARPQPTLGDIKGASAFEQDADVVGMVWREDDPTSGRPQDHGLIYTLKQRMDVPGGVPVIFHGAKASFEREL
jgi:replicative DNA helicase